VCSEIVKRDFLYGFQDAIFSQSVFELLVLFRLRVVNKQWRNSITGRMIAGAIQREVPLLVGLQVDRPINFYVDIARSYYAKCSMSRLAVDYHVGRYATENFCSSLRHMQSALPRSTIWAHIFCRGFSRILHTREGRGFVLASVSAWLGEATRNDGSVVFYDEAIDFLDTLERIVRNEFVVIGSRITTGIIDRH